MRIVIDLAGDDLGRPAGFIRWAGSSDDIEFSGWIEMLRLLEVAIGGRAGSSPPP